MSDNRPDDRKSLGERIRSEKLTRAMKRNAIMRLAAHGMTDEQIATSLTNEWTQRNPPWPKISKTSVKRIRLKTLEDMAKEDRENAELVRQQELARLDNLIFRLSPKVEKGEVTAVREVRRLVELKLRATGGMAPQKHEHIFPGGLEGIDPDRVQQMEDRWRETVEGSVEEDDQIEDATEVMAIPEVAIVP